jgi:hypothetical protein
MAACIFVRRHSDIQIEDTEANQPEFVQPVKPKHESLSHSGKTKSTESSLKSVQQAHISQRTTSFMDETEPQDPDIPPGYGTVFINGVAFQAITATNSNAQSRILELSASPTVDVAELGAGSGK